MTNLLSKSQLSGEFVVLGFSRPIVRQYNKNLELVNLITLFTYAVFVQRVFYGI